MEEGSDLLYGCEAIAEHLGLGIQQVKHRIRKRDIPTFRIGRNVCARRSTLLGWLARIEAEAGCDPDCGHVDLNGEL
jgi:hypothetical protein